MAPTEGCARCPQIPSRRPSEGAVGGPSAHPADGQPQLDMEDRALCDRAGNRDPFGLSVETL